MISSLVSKRTDREFETSIDSLIKLSQTGCSQTLLVCTPNATANGCIGSRTSNLSLRPETSHAFC
jgi:hypothetical protein